MNTKNLRPLKNDNIAKYITEDARTQAEIAAEAKVTGGVITRIKEPGHRCRRATAENIRKALGMKPSLFYEDYTPSYKRASAEEMVDLSNPALFADYITRAGYTYDDMSRKIRKSRRYVATAIENKRIEKEGFQAICRVLGQKPEIFLNQPQKPLGSFTPKPRVRAEAVRAFEQSTRVADKDKVRENLRKIKGEDELEALKIENAKLRGFYEGVMFMRKEIEHE